MKIAVLDDYQDAFRKLAVASRLEGHEVVTFREPARDFADQASRLRPFDALLLTQQRTPLPGSLAEQLPNLKFVSQTGGNTAHIDVAALTRQGVVVSAGGAGGGPTPTVELTWALILAAQRQIPQEVEALKAGLWQTSVGTGLSGRTLGIYALGRIGGLVAKVGQAFGMNVLCWGREGSLANAKSAGYAVAASREAFFSTADVVSLHLTLNKETRGIVTAADLAVMKPDALLVNTSRAPIIAAGALVAALQQGRPGRAAVDVYEEEPVLGATHPLIGMSNVICTPHLGYVEHANYEAIFGAAVDQILAFAAGKPINIVQPPAS
jgi:D-3-phosphoglycerate dehydrogenase